MAREPMVVQSEMPIVRLMKVRNRLPSDAVFSGRTAAWLHGLDMPACDPVEVTLPRTSCMSRLAGVSLVRSDVGPTEKTVSAQLPVTSPVRTVADLGRRLHETEAVVAIDTALHRRLVKVEELRSWASEHARYRGASRLVTAIGWSDGRAESPMESRLRMLLVLNGLPKPILQPSLSDETGGFIGRPDLYYADARLAIEYDGGTHRFSRAADNRRQNRLLEAGYRLLRFTAGDILRTPASVVGQVERALASRPI